jgi:hypothetical protein
MWGGDDRRPVAGQTVGKTYQGARGLESGASDEGRKPLAEQFGRFTE